MNTEDREKQQLMTDLLSQDWEREGGLISVLQKTQEIFGYIPGECIYQIAQSMGMSPAKIIGVTTFYSQFRLEPVGQYIIQLCQGTACHVNGAARIEQAIEDMLGIKDGETTADGLFTLKSVACLGCCSLSPVMMINGDTYGSLTPDKARAILSDIAAGKEAAI